MKRTLTIAALVVATLALTTPAQAHDGNTWYPEKWNLSEVGNNIKWGLMPDWFSNSGYEARAQDGADDWTALGGNRDLNQRNDWSSNWTVESCSSAREKNGLRKIGPISGHPSWLAETYWCTVGGTMWSANIGFVDTVNWYNGIGSPGSNEFDFWSVSSHEFGHLLGQHEHWDDAGYAAICNTSEPREVMCKSIPPAVVRGSPQTHDKHTFNDAY